jgi:hypothetical protein
MEAEMTDTILKFFGTHPILAWTLTWSLLFVIGGLIAAVFDRFRCWWIDREIERQAVQRRQFMKLMSASSESRPWASPAAKGFDRNHRRVS